MDSPTVLEVGSPKILLGLKSGVSKDAPSAGSKGDLLSCLFQLLEASQMPWLVTPFFIITPTSAFVITSPFPL